MHSLPTSAVALADTAAELDTDLVTPGVLGFLVIFAIALGLYFLMRSMTGKLSHVRGAQEDETARRRERKAGRAVPVDGAAEADEAGSDAEPAGTGESGAAGNTGPGAAEAGSGTEPAGTAEVKAGSADTGDRGGEERGAADR